MCLAVPGCILSLSGDDPMTRLGRVDFGGIIKVINLAFAPEAFIGDYVLVHAGFAIAVIDAAEADRILAHLHQLTEAVDDGRGPHEAPR